MEILTMEVPVWLTISLSIVGYVVGVIIEHYRMKGN